MTVKKVTPTQLLDYLKLEADVIEVIPTVHNSQKNAVMRWLNQENKLFEYINNLELVGQINKNSVKKIHNNLIKQNKRQVKIVQSASNYPIFCIQGPPGTGKTSIIKEIIKQELSKNKKKIILVSSQSNLAVDNILERLTDQKILRLGQEQKISKKIKPYQLDRFHKKLKRKKLISNILRFFLMLPIYLLRKPPKRVKTKVDLYNSVSKKIKIIGATCIGLDHKLINYLEQRNLLDLVIIDEAGKSTIMESLVAMQHCKRVILVGDQKQLPPVLDQKIKNIWLRKNDSINNCPGYYSFFEYAFKNINNDAKNILDTQYRMHPQIGTFISKVFYEDESLKNGISSEQRTLELKGYPDAISYHPTARFKEKRYEKFSNELKSYYNPLEAKIAEKLVEKFDQKTSISIISFYSAQKLLLEKTFKKNKNIKIATLDSFQGREDDVIIISLVRSRINLEDALSYRFFLDVKRLNVAFSRAKKRLMIIGDLEHILEIKKNKEKIDGIEVIEKLYSYIIENKLTVKI